MAMCPECPELVAQSKSRTPGIADTAAKHEERTLLEYLPSLPVDYISEKASTCVLKYKYEQELKQTQHWRIPSPVEVVHVVC